MFEMNILCLLNWVLGFTSLGVTKIFPTTFINYRDVSLQKQRSVSLSSLDDNSDVDLEPENKSRKRETNNKNRTSISQSSTHSLNEADFVKVVEHTILLK